MEEDLNLKNLSIDCVPRCLNCNLIPSIKLYYNERKPMINYECQNKHKGNISLEEYMQKYNKNTISNQKCDECNKNQNEFKIDYSYCSKCNKFMYNICLDKHRNDDDHNFINFQRYDSLCNIHSNLFSFYCIKCKINICIYCKSNHKSHDLIDLSTLVYTDEEKKKLDEEIKNMELKIINLDKIKQEIKNKIDNLKKSSELEMKFIKILLFAYEYEEKQNNLNFFVFLHIHMQIIIFL